MAVILKIITTKPRRHVNAEMIYKAVKNRTTRMPVS